MNFYNDINPFCCEWLRLLIAAGLIPAGVVDNRSITEIHPDELKQYTQCHFFAGIGGWPLALRIAGVADDEPIDTGSCPCQPFSQTGKRGGYADARHLWPDFARIERVRRAPIVLGEQVASKDGRAWLDGVSADMEALDYAFGSADLCSAGVGAPNIRQRLYWMAHANRSGFQGARRAAEQGIKQREAVDIGGGCDAGGVEHSNGTACQQGRADTAGSTPRSDEKSRAGLGGAGFARWLGHPDSPGPQGRNERGNGGDECAAWETGLGLWHEYELIACADDKRRRIEPRTFPLAHGIPARLGPVLTALRPMGRSAIKAARDSRIGRLHGYGNAINPAVAAVFIKSALESRTNLLGRVTAAQAEPQPLCLDE